MSSNSLRDQAAQKEREWRELEQLQIQSLETALKSCQKELKDEKAKLDELKDHFKYNLKLINDRDAELQRYDELFLELKVVSQQKEVEISELKVKIDELKVTAGSEAKAREELQLHYKQRLHEKEAEFDHYRSVKDAEVSKERAALESAKQSLDRKVVELEHELDTDRRKITAEFEEAACKREHEYRLHVDQLNVDLLSHQLRVKTLNKEIELLKAARESTGRECEQAETTQKQLEKQLRQKDWELEDVTAMSHARISELECKLQHNEQSLTRQTSEFQHKYAELDRVVKEKDSSVTKLREAAQEREAQLQAEMKSLTAKLEESAVRIRQLEWTAHDLQKEKSSVIERLEAELSDVKLRWESDVAERSRENVARDVELTTLRDTDAKLRAELTQRKHDVDRYKKDLALAVERQAELEQSKAQLQLDWQRRYEELERLQYAQSEDLVKMLSNARNEALAQVRAHEVTMQEKDELIKLLTKERDQALNTLNRHGLMADRNIEETNRVAELQHQNEELRRVVRHMRRDIETLGNQVPAAVTRDDQAPVSMNSAPEAATSSERIASLEKQLKESRSECLQLQQQLSAMENSIKPTEPNTFVKNGQMTDVDSGLRMLSKDNVIIASHMQQLNKVIGSLRTEKLDLTTQLRKQQLRIVHLENLVDQLSKQPREKQVQIDQLEYELGAVKRRTDTEVCSLRQRIADLELQVTEARKEADEYYRAGVERNTEATALANQLSLLKLEFAQANPAVNFGAQELLIQQLQDEISMLRRCGTQINGTDNNDKSVNLLHDNTVTELREQLRKAATHIRQLARDKRVLIEVGNRLRAELLQHGMKPPSPTRHRQPLSVQPANYEEPNNTDLASPQRTLLHHSVQNKLRQLEQLQYNLTKQEMAQSQRQETRVSESLSDKDDDRPRSILKPAPSRDVAVTSLRPTFAQDAATSPTRLSSDRDASKMQLMASMSSVGGGDSLQDVWAMMESGLVSPRTATPRHPNTDSGSRPERDTGPQHGVRPRSSDSLTVQGSKTTVQPRSAVKKNLTPRTAGKAITISHRAKIRNYNVKDDLSSGH